MSQFVGYMIWLLLAATLPLSAYVYYRSKNRVALVMLAGSLLIWGGALMVFFIKPEIIVLPHANDAVNISAVGKSSELGGNLLVIGFIVLLSGGLATTITHRKGKGNAV